MVYKIRQITSLGHNFHYNSNLSTQYGYRDVSHIFSRTVRLFVPFERSCAIDLKEKCGQIERLFIIWIGALLPLFHVGRKGRNMLKTE